MATTSSARDSSNGNKGSHEKAKKGSFLFFGRSSSKSKEPDTPTRVGIFSARTARPEQIIGDSTAVDDQLTLAFECSGGSK